VPALGGHPSQRTDSVQPFSGQIDDVRVLDRVLPCD